MLVIGKEEEKNFVGVSEKIKAATLWILQETPRCFTSLEMRWMTTEI